MNGQETFQIENHDEIKLKLFSWLRNFDICCILDSHTKTYPSHKFSYQDYNIIIAAGCKSEISSENGNSLDDLDHFLDAKQNWHFGYLSYDLKNHIEDLQSDNIDKFGWPDFYFFSPEILIFLGNKKIEIQISDASHHSPKNVWKDITQTKRVSEFKGTDTTLEARLSKQEYLDQVEKLRAHILRGDIYEVNFCQEFFSQTPFDAFSAYSRLNEISPTPFSSFFRLRNKFVLSASPERYLKKTGNKIVSQPIKGTTKRGDTPELDHKLIQYLKNTTKEKAENIMIVDLVRNDLSRIAVKNSVKVEELCGVYSFKQVHQMISTISAETNTNKLNEIIKVTFPMGSMTGAPKISAMKLAEKYETTKRGLYSGAIGYISPKKDFDFNVVIRSLQYNSENHYLSYMVGGAITFLSDAEQEYEECLIKASAITELLSKK